MVDWEKCDWCGRMKVQRERCNCENKYSHERSWAEHTEKFTGAQQRKFRQLIEEKENGSRNKRKR